MATTAPTTRAEVNPRSKRAKKHPAGGRRWQFIFFLAPAAIFIGALVIYPLVDTIAQSFQNDARQFIGGDNYQEIVQNERIKTAIKNTFIWVVIAPALVTGFGVIVAVLVERVRYSTAIKLILFMPFAISGLAAGVLWRITYDPEPQRGLINASIAGFSKLFDAPGQYQEARPLPDSNLKAQGGGFVSDDTVSPGDTAELGLVNILDAAVPSNANDAQPVEPSSDAIRVLVWRDFKPGGGKPGEVESGEPALPGTEVQLISSSGEIVTSGVTNDDGVVEFSDVEGEPPYNVGLGASNFDTGFEGIAWLGPSLVTPALMAIFFWGSVGFAVVVIGGGLAALPRDLLEAARVDGANEWQVFRRITLPLLRPVLGVVFISMSINVLKMFDIIWVTAPGGSQAAANVIAVEMFRTAFTERNFGVGAAVACLLFVLVIPIMVLNLRQFRRED